MNNDKKDVRSIDSITAEGIFSQIDNDLQQTIRVEVLEKTTSTNTLLKLRASKGEAEGLVLVAGEQSDGRGRLGRSFFSPGDTGLYMSILLKPQIKPERAVMVTTAAAVSVCEALEKVGGPPASVKWVNDIFVNDKKVCGILTEAGFSAGNEYLDYVVLGIGVNVYAPDNGFPEELSDIAGSVFDCKQIGLRNKIAAEILNCFTKYYKYLNDGLHCSAYAERCFVIGRKVNVVIGESERQATVLGVNDDCSLLVRYSNGEKATLSSGEISVKVEK